MTAAVNKNLLADSSNTPTDAARVGAVASEHAGDWLHAAQITAVGLRLSDEAMRVARVTVWQARPANLMRVFVERRWMQKDYTNCSAARVLCVKYVTHI